MFLMQRSGQRAAMCLAADSTAQASAEAALDAGSELSELSKQVDAVRKNGSTEINLYGKSKVNAQRVG